MGGTNRLINGFGLPVDSDQNTLTAGPKGPTPVQGVHLIEKLAHFDRERVRERAAKALGPQSVEVRRLAMMSQEDRVKATAK